MSVAARVVRRPRLLALGAAAVLSCLGVLTPSQASAAAPAAAPSAVRAERAQSAASVPVSRLAFTGTATRVTVRKIYRSGQKSWVDHVLDDRLVDVDGCQARRAGTSWRSHTYRSTVYSVCPEGPRLAESAARALSRSRPWYQVSVGRTRMVGFTLVADLPSGNDRAVPAAVRTLPTGPSVFFEGDDVALTWVGPAISQARLNAAVDAFATALGVDASAVTITPLAGS